MLFLSHFSDHLCLIYEGLFPSLRSKGAGPWAFLLQKASFALFQFVTNLVALGFVFGRYSGWEVLLQILYRGSFFAEMVTLSYLGC